MSRTPPAPAPSALALDLFSRLLPEPSWRTWRIFVRALQGLPLTPEELAIFQGCTGRQRAPTQPASEGWVIAGRRSGKTRAASALAVWAATVPTYKLAGGEKGIILLLGADKRQAGIAKSYISDMLKSEPALAALVQNETKESIELRVHGHDLSIEVGTSNYRLIRGRTICAAILDELCFWPTDERSAEPDREALIAIRPALATTGGLLLALSSPYRQQGAMYQAFRTLYGNDERPDAICWRAPTALMNELVSADVIRRAYDEDASAAASEWGAEWRPDLEDLFAPGALSAVTVLGRRELPPMPGVLYVAYCDPSGGVQDSMCLAIAHRDPLSGVAVLDAIRERRPPFSPADKAREDAGVLKPYGVTIVKGDKYSGQWCGDEYARHGITYQFSERTTSEVFLEALALVNSSRVELLDDARLLAQLGGLERRVGRTGRDACGHRPGGHDDLAAAVCGALVQAVTGSGRALFPPTFTSCCNDVAAPRCALLGRGPWLPSDGHCQKHCAGYQVAAPLFGAYRRSLASGEVAMNAREFVQERFEPTMLTTRYQVEQTMAAWGI